MTTTTESTPTTHAEAGDCGRSSPAQGSALGGDEIIYMTGCTPDGTPLIGGVWTLRDQEGFPLEMSHLVARDKGWLIDWAEAMADASRSNNCPALMKAVEAFLPSHVITHLKVGFVQMVRSGKSFEQVIAEKRANGKKMEAFVRAVAVELSNQNIADQRHSPE